MKKMLMLIACACAMLFPAFSGDDEVTVKVSVAGHNNSALRKQCEVQGKKVAIKKYLEKMGNAKITEKVIDEAMASYAKFIEGIETDDPGPEYEDGELTCSYTVTIKQADIAKWLEGEGIDLNAAADGSSLEIFVMEEPPDAGQMLLGEEVGNFFFARYNMFQRRIRDALVKKVGEIGFKVILLEDNENYEAMKEKDPVLVGVSYDVNEKKFTQTPGFLRTVQENNPDAIALYYRIDALALNAAADPKEIRVTVALNFKNLSKNTTENIGSRDLPGRSDNNKPDMIMADIGTVVERAMNALLSGEEMRERLVHTVKSMRNAAARPKGPMKLVINCKNVDSKIKIRVRNGLKKQLIAAGLTKQTKVVKDSLSCVVMPSKDYGDLDDVWGKVSEIIPELLGDDIEISDDWAKKNGDTLTVTIGGGK